MSQPELRESRQRYNIAREVHQVHAKAVADASVGGALPSKNLLDNEANAVRALSDARGRLMSAITAAIAHREHVHSRHPV